MVGGGGGVGAEPVRAEFRKIENRKHDNVYEIYIGKTLYHII